MNKTFFYSAIVMNSFFLLNCKQATPSPNTPDNQVVTKPSDPTVGCTDALAKNYKSTAKEDDCSCLYDFPSKVSTTIPANFNKQVLIEQHTGTWCGWCPLGKETIKKLESSHNAIGIEVHYNDAMAIVDKVYNPLKSKYGHPPFPSGMVDRQKSVAGTTFIMGESEWKVNVENIMKNPKTTVGITIESVLNGKELTVLTKFIEKTATTNANYGLGIYLVEENVTGYPQPNYASRNAQFSQYDSFNLPSMINDIKHHNVSRDTLAPILRGVAIPKVALQQSKIYSKMFKTTIPSTIIVPANLKIVAFIVNQDNGQILNARITPVGIIKNWE